MSFFRGLFGATLLSLFLAPFATKADDSVFLFSYFTGNGLDGLHFLRSDDGMTWTKVHKGDSFLTPTVDADKLMRDPCIFQGPDGEFRMVWTTSWKSRNIGYAHSKDLIHWSQQQAIPVMDFAPTTLNSWAPELTYDRDRHHYIIYWASTVPGKFPATEHSAQVKPTDPLYNHRIYCTTTEDFVSFGPTRLLYDGGFNAIDVTMAPNGNEWLMFVKDETLNPVPQKNIHMVKAKTPEGPFGPLSAPITGASYWAEGPTSIKIGNAWFVYFDRYRDHRFGVVRSTDLVHWEDLSDQLKMPKETRHGTVIRVPRSLADSLE